MQHTFSASFRGAIHTVTIRDLHEPHLSAAIGDLGLSAAAECKVRREMYGQLANRLASVRSARAQRKARPNPLSVVARWQRWIHHSQDARRLIRRVSGESHGWDVEVVGGEARDREPRLVGSSFDFRWRGKWKSAAGSYIPSTHRIQVGVSWLREHYGLLHRAVRELSRSRGPITVGPEAYPLISWSQELVRRLVDHVGWETLIEYLEADMIARTEAGTLWRIDAQTVVLQVRCPSTGSTYCLRVPPSSTDPELARRWTLGIAGDDRIVAES